MAKKKAAPLEESIRQELADRAGEAGDPPPEDETPPEDTPPVDEEPTEEELQAGPDDEEGEDEGEDDEGERTPPPGKKPGRGRRQFGDLRRRAQDAERERDELRAREAAREQQRQEEEGRRAQAAAEENRRRMEAEIAALPPEEQGPRRQALFNQAITAEMQKSQRLQADNIDSRNFARQCRNDPVLNDIADEVEAMAEQYLSRGVTVNRNTIANYILGERYRKMRASKKPPRTARRAQPSNRGDSGGGGGGTGRRQVSTPDERRARMERLRDKPV